MAASDDLEFELKALLEPERDSIPDAGFSQRVVAKLPHRRFHPLLRVGLITGMTALGCLLALIVLPGGQALQEYLAKVPKMEAVQSLPIPWLILVYTCCAVLIKSVLQEWFGAVAPGNRIK